MHLIYFDESGNSGNNLNDAEQPIFVLGALSVPEGSWQSLERDLETSLSSCFPDLSASGVEIHSGDLRASRGVFKGLTVDRRVALRDAWIKVARDHAL